MSFDRLAPHYRWMEAILAGPLLQRCRTHFLTELKPIPQNILCCGEGPGRFLTACRQQFPDATITCVDSSARMLAIAKDQLLKVGPTNGNTEFIHENLLKVVPRTGFDLIATHFFLDCFSPDQLAHLIPRLSAISTPTAQWLITDFQVAPSGWQRLRSQWLLRGMYRFFRAMTDLPAKKLTDPSPLLEISGWKLRRRQEFNHRFIRSDWWGRA